VFFFVLSETSCDSFSIKGVVSSLSREAPLIPPAEGKRFLSLPYLVPVIPSALVCCKKWSDWDYGPLFVFSFSTTNFLLVFFSFLLFIFAVVPAKVSSP